MPIRAGRCDAIVSYRYYSGYADHMWRFYTRYPDIDLAAVPPSDRANWLACHNTFARLRPDWQAALVTYYSPGKPSQPLHPNTHFIVRTAQRMAAEERGLIEKTDRGWLEPDRTDQCKE